MNRHAFLAGALSVSLGIFFVSLPVSVSGIEIGKGLSILVFLFALVSAALMRDRDSSRLSNRLTISKIVFLLFVLSVLISFATTKHWGDSHSGTLRQIPVMGSLLLFSTLAAFQLGRLSFSISKITRYVFAAAMGVAFIYSLISRDGRTHGFFLHPVVYSHVLALCLTILIFFLGAGVKKTLSDFLWTHILNTLGIACLLALGVADFYFNESRSLLLPLSVVPLLVFLYFIPAIRTKRKLLAMALPASLLLIALAALLSGTKQFDKILHHIHFYYREDPQATFQPSRFETSGSNRVGLMILEGAIANGLKPLDEKIHFQYIPSMYEGDEPLLWSGSEGSFSLRFPLTNISRPQAFYIEWHLPVDLKGRNGSLRKISHERYFFSYDPGSKKSPSLFWSESRVGIDRHSSEFSEDKAKLRVLRFIQYFRFTFFEDIRAWIWRSSLFIASNGPLFGVGPGNWSYAAHNYSFNPAAPILDRLTELNGGIFHSHNNFLTMAVELGIPGLILYTALLLILLTRGLWRIFRKDDFDSPSNRDHYFLAILILLVTSLSGFFDYTVFGVIGNFHWFALGWLLAFETPRTSQKSS